MLFIRRFLPSLVLAVWVVLAPIGAECATDDLGRPNSAEPQIAQIAQLRTEPWSPSENRLGGPPRPARLVVVPQLTGLPLATAGTRVRGLGLRLTVANRRDVGSDSRIESQEPPAGARLRVGEVVTVTLASQPRQALVAPDLVGLSLAEAAAKTKSLNLTLNLRSRTEASPESKVATQAPMAGTPIRIGGVIAVTTTPVEELVTVPDITKKRIRDAEQEVAAANLHLKIEPAGETLTDVAEVVSQDPPPGRRVRARSMVTATIAIPAVLVTVPNIVGLKVGAAEERLRPSLVLTQPSLGRDWPVVATVVSQRPEPGTRVRVGSAVSITVELPAPPVPPPHPTPAPQPPPVITQPDPTPIVRPIPAPPPEPSPSATPAPGSSPLVTPAPIPAPAPIPTPIVDSSTQEPVSSLVPSQTSAWLLGVTALVAILLGTSMWRWRRRRRFALPVHISLCKDAGRGRAVIDREAEASPSIGIRFGHDAIVTRIRASVEPG
jgi:beta-lactam-binding protein with PASTA domain